MDGPDRPLRHTLASELPWLPLKNEPRYVEALVSHLKTDSDAFVRYYCAFALHDIRAPCVVDAYIHATRDRNIHVALDACQELGRRGGSKAVAALYQCFGSPSWDVRFHACRGLVELEAADARVVNELEQLIHNSIAKEYDRDIDKYNRDIQRYFPLSRFAPQDRPKPLKKVATVLKEAREMAARKK
jgi:hypothetical protein